MTANEIRKKFLDFFKSKGHTIVDSDSLVPKDDPTVLFTTAGMQQFKRQFLGHIEGYTRAASSQKCLRTDDLEKVGKTPVHHTFFEMLGNFSFGDYFKKDAITWAWEFFTKVLGIPSEKLWVSVYHEDTEAYDVWLNDIHVPKDRILKLGDKDNFWPAEAKEKGPNGPCGPCSEIFFDFGVNPECPHKEKCDPTCSCGRFTEVWNLVFTQFNRKDGGVLEPLPAKNIDTGMGFERLVAVMQGKKSNFETDLFQPTLTAIDAETKHFGYSLNDTDKRIIADHIRAITFGIADGVVPSNEGRGYIMKRLIIDATDKMIPMGRQGTRLYKLIPTVAKVMQEPYPELSNKRVDEISGIVQRTQGSYLITRNERIPELKRKNQEIANNPSLPVEQKLQQFADIGFLNRDTYGLTLGAIVSTAEAVVFTTPQERESIVPQLPKEINKRMDQQRERSRAGSKMTGDVFADAELNLNVPKTEFIGYEHFKGTGKILKIFIDNKEVPETQEGDSVTVVLDKTPFYAESGGQVGDTGLVAKDGAAVRVNDTQKISDVYLHSGIVEKGNFRVNDAAYTQIDEERRLSIMRNHTATHLLQAALKQVLGGHVQQQGSLVAEDRLRFDFTHPQSITREKIERIESLINGYILACDPVDKAVMSLQAAKGQGALAYFAEKYKDTVRVVSIDGYSKELCGGTHLKLTGQVGLFKVTGESAIAQGIRRIEAVTGTRAIDYVNKKEKQLESIARMIKSPSEEVVSRVNAQSKQVKELEKKLSQLKFDSIKNSLDEFITKAPKIHGTSIVDLSLSDVDVDTLRRTVDLVKLKIPSGAVIVGSTFPDSAVMIVATSEDLVAKGIFANQIIKELPPTVQFYGGGQPNFAQAGSKDPKQLPTAIEKAKNWIREKLS